MKKILLAAVAAVMSVGASAQAVGWDNGAPEKTVTLGVRAGMNIATMGGEDTSDTKTKFGFRGGVSADFNIVRSFSINSGLFFTQKGCKGDIVEDVNGGLVSADCRMTMNFIELPVYLSYHLNFDALNSTQIFFGPYFDFGVYGKMTASTKYSGQKTSASVDVFDDPYEFKRFHAGLGLGASHTYGNFVFGLSYQWGLTDVVSGVGNHWNNFNVSVGYNF
ncbi:porin family protein [uncultured Duncaniella sp.]|uniref:porin family protein n=1 Tax=uncultured Duncaniella sp. TaxID=2768039 RepID=UPI0025FC19D6|nr:porin family protein [uncultured Duncaniella sp.]